MSLFSSQMTDSKKEELELDLSALEKKEQQTKPDYRDVGVQNSSDCCDNTVQNKKVAVENKDMAVQTHEATGVETNGIG